MWPGDMKWANAFGRMVSIDAQHRAATITCRKRSIREVQWSMLLWATNFVCFLGFLLSPSLVWYPSHSESSTCRLYHIMRFGILVDKDWMRLSRSSGAFAHWWIKLFFFFFFDKSWLVGSERLKGNGEIKSSPPFSGYSQALISLCSSSWEAQRAEWTCFTSALLCVSAVGCEASSSPGLHFIKWFIRIFPHLLSIFPFLSLSWACIFLPYREFSWWLSWFRTWHGVPEEDRKSVV